ncbi:Similar to ASPIC and UnbV protein containing FG-GAP repeats [Zobellia galactanivorans]|uniref:Similar to ASPIC and UnbV protein containing FG-GAP repeats n=1 Tax=Zobellia galactanivorans (strain DSM 12802 / CCUG 47099 / CIP 106680 / NCIMB 13871 / Dsij) TaxID=63186 RepID=G0LBK5_ZOBGA|nr:Similar to ASPIC and UnbV protein containing FG-GAP repeats [Zobellia galactanivorans]
MLVGSKIRLFCRVLFTFAALVLISCADAKKDALFRSIAASESGLTFENRLQLRDSLTILDFEYMYNGAGVAIADFDLDGLQDIYFTGNMVSNRLYRNLGGFKFEDITEAANVGSANWSNGVAIVDINQDGYPDIYVCRAGPRGAKDEDMANLLFVNNGMENGKLFFTEEAQKWGLADTSYSVQSVFFDYDGDGDLDMYLLNNALVDFNRNTARPKDKADKVPSVDKLYRNDSGKKTEGKPVFTDVSLESGILIGGYGLGVEVCDINEDGWPDVYVSNDFLTDDLLYINQKDGSFKNEIASYFKHLTFNGMGNDIADIDNDGNMDVVVLDMLPPDNKRWKLTMMGNNYDQFRTRLDYGYQPQYIRNTLQLNNGNGSFSEVGQLAGIDATEWSWSALFADFDQDGLNDLCITNGYRQDITNLDFMVYGDRVLTMGTEEANRKKRIEELNKLPGIKETNYFFKNTGNLSFEDQSEEVGFDSPTYSNGMAYADLDNDGDLDLVINNIDDPAGLYENTISSEMNRYIRFKFKGPQKNKQALGSQVEVFYDDSIQKKYFTPYRGYLSTVEQALHFGVGQLKTLDSVKVIWPDGKMQKLENISTNQELVLAYEDAEETKPNSRVPASGTWFRSVDSIGLDRLHVENDFVDFKVQALLPHMHSRNGPGLAVADSNGDGLEDLYMGGARGQAGVLMLQEKGSFTSYEFEETEHEDMGALFFDVDNDGDQDLYVVSGGSSFPVGDKAYQDRLYENDGSGNFTKRGALPNMPVSGSVAAAADYDKDGDLDLFIGGRVRPGEYPMAPESFLLQNNSVPGKLKFTKDTQSISGVFKDLGMVTSALWTDFNNDNWPDLIVTGEFMAIRFFRNDKGQFSEITEQTGLSHTHGWWNSIVSGDFDNDGDTDYILGNLGLNSKFKASAKEPLCIYASDYDKNGQIDPVMCHYVDGKNYVAHSRNDLIDQINAMRSRFRTFSDYAEATFEESFLKEEIENAHVVKSETFANSYLENLGSGKFRLSELSRPAQIAPMYGMMVGDYNGDRNLDVLAVGNFYGGEVFSGRYDASIGWLFLGDGSGSFGLADVSQSGFFVEGDAKSLVGLNAAGKELVVVGRNNEGLKTFYRPMKNRMYIPKPNDVYALMTFENGDKQKVEIHYGGGYLSSTSRNIAIPEAAVSVKIMDGNGRETEILDTL